MGIFYCVSSIDVAASSINYIYLERYSEMNELVGFMPSVWAILLASVLFYLILAFSLFLAAPTLSRLIVPAKYDKQMECGSLDVAVITSSAMLIAGWVFMRLVDYGHGLVNDYQTNGAVDLSNGGVFYILSNLVILQASFLMVKKMPIVLKWLKSKAAE